MELLAGEDNEFWENIQDFQKDRKIGARKDIGDPVIEHRHITVQPNALVAQVEHAGGLAPDALLANDTVASLFKAIESITEEFGIQNLNRAGVRFYYLADAGSTDFVLSRLKGKLSAAMTAGISEAIGEIQDMGLAFDGAMDNRAKYHLRFGPLGTSELKRTTYFEHITQALSAQTRASLIVDTDLYEENFSLKGRRSRNWVKSQLVSFNKLISSLSSTLNEEQGG